MGFWHISGGWAADAASVALALAESLGGTPQPLPDSHSGTAVAPPEIALRGVVIDLSLSTTAGEIRRDPDGLFYVNALVNGVRVRFLVDTGASTIVLTPADAGRAGVLPQAAEFHDSAETAGGRTAMARVKLARLVVGPVEQRDVDAAVVGSGLNVSLLGQSWLTQLQSVTISGDRMVLQ